MTYEDITVHKLSTILAYAFVANSETGDVTAETNCDGNCLSLDGIFSMDEIAKYVIEAIEKNIK